MNSDSTTVWRRYRSSARAATDNTYAVDRSRVHSRIRVHAKQRILAEAETNAAVLDGAAKRVSVQFRHGLGCRVNVSELDKAHGTVGLEAKRELPESSTAAKYCSELVFDLRQHSTRGVAGQIANKQRIDRRMVVTDHVAAARRAWKIRTWHLLRGSDAIFVNGRRTEFERAKVHRHRRSMGL